MKTLTMLCAALLLHGCTIQSPKGWKMTMTADDAATAMLTISKKFGGKEPRNVNP